MNTELEVTEISRNVLKLLRSANISEEVSKRVGLQDNNVQVTKVKGSGVAYPYRDYLGNIVTYRIGLAKPYPDEKGKKVKYLQEANSLPYPFYDPIDLEKIFKSNCPMIFTEGEKKLLALKSNNAFLEFPILSFPGAHNWQPKGSGGEMSEGWSAVPLKGRRIILMGDTDMFTNQMVYHGYTGFINELTKRGARVELIDLRKEGEDPGLKIGADDALEKFGCEFILGKIGKPDWIFVPVDHVHFDIDNQEEFINSLVILKQAVWSRLFDQIKSVNNKFSKSTAKMMLMESQRTWAKYRPKKDLDESVVPWNPDTETLKKLFVKIGEKMSLIPSFYRYENLSTFVSVVENEARVLATPQRLGAFLSNHITYRKVKEEPDGEKFQPIEHIPENHLIGLIEERSNIQNVKEVRFVTATPQIFNQKIICDSGYDIESKVYYTGEKIILSDSTSCLSELLDSFPFETEIDKVNCLGLLLSLFYIQEFVGNHPAIIIQGDEQNLGKTTLARCIAILLQKKEAQLLAWTNDEELQKKMSAILMDNDVAIIDNVKAGRDTTIISSQALEGFVTAPELTFRALGENRVFSRPNNALFIFTLNKGSFSDDLVVRSVNLSLSYKNKKVMNEDFDPVAFVFKNRGKILGEIANMVSRSFLVNESVQLNSGNFKFKSWAKKVQCVLRANGFDGFLSNQVQLSKRVNPLHCQATIRNRHRRQLQFRMIL